MSYPHRDPYQWDNVHGDQQYVSGYDSRQDNRRTSLSHSPHSPVRGGDNPLANRLLSTTQAQQPFDIYGAGQNREPGLQYVPSTHTPQYIGHQGQTRHVSFQEPPDNAAAAFATNVSGYYSQSSQAVHAGPCRYPNCHRPAVRDGETQELTEYCSLEHMREDIRRGVPLCSVCNRRPRRINSNYCGSSCERWDIQRQQPRHQQYDTSPSRATSSGNVAWSIPTGHVRCPNCGTTYSTHGRSQPLYETGRSLPPCPSCGYY
ncbi:hypothetical protein DFH94DRAFT_757892 [Russula ochroleuca]|uniref:Uncharacterized protein n=1 Tax=Russula ochroleuca TaxID=152965 RepID=A0A9P5MSG3_9AGAM|nr:hypothetical protein DFH94DRAFT_757892 [Russula ochroleuca]